MSLVDLYGRLSVDRICQSLHLAAEALDGLAEAYAGDEHEHIYQRQAADVREAMFLLKNAAPLVAPISTVAEAEPEQGESSR